MLIGFSATSIYINGLNYFNNPTLCNVKEEWGNQLTTTRDEETVKHNLDKWEELKLKDQLAFKLGWIQVKLLSAVINNKEEQANVEDSRITECCREV